MWYLALIISFASIVCGFRAVLPKQRSRHNEQVIHYKPKVPDSFEEEFDESFSERIEQKLEEKFPTAKSDSKKGSNSRIETNRQRRNG
jgi:hypothetical protein